MSSIVIDGTTVFVGSIETVEEGVSYEYLHLSEAVDKRYFNLCFEMGYAARSPEKVEELRKRRDEIVFLKASDYPAVIVKLTSGREFRIVGKTKAEVMEEIERASNGWQ